MRTTLLASHFDPMANNPLKFEIAVLPSGTVTVWRSPGCTKLDLTNVCTAVSKGHVRVLDLTPPIDLRWIVDENGQQENTPS